MGFNTIHTNNDAFLEGYNETNQTSFFYKCVSKNQLSRMTLTNNLSIDSVSLIIQVNGRIEFDKRDVFIVLGKRYRVQDYSTSVVEYPMRKRIDFDNAQGDTVITLG